MSVTKRGRLRRRVPLVAFSALTLGLSATSSALAHSNSEHRAAPKTVRAVSAEHDAQHASAERAPSARSVARSRKGVRSRVMARAAAVPADDGQWRAPFSIPSVAIHAVLLRTGKILYYDTTGKGSNEGDAYLLDPRTKTTQRILPPPVNGRTPNLWCGGQSVLPDGRVLLTGGTLAYGPFRGLRHVYTFDPITESFTRHGDMAHGRWYPSNVGLADGRVAIMSGLDENGLMNNDIEVFDPKTNTTSLVGRRGEAGMPAAGGYYPHMFQMPSGKALLAGPNVGGDSFLFSLSGSTFSWTDVANLPHQRKLSSAVLMPGASTTSGRVMIIGGGSKSIGPTKTSEVFDESTRTWKPGPLLNTARAHHNTVQLPDGSMVTIGGGSSTNDDNLFTAGPEHLMPELYDPATQTWRLGPPQVERRAYHSTAVLLPDATVLSSGDDGGNDLTDTVEVYEPAYLHKGIARPTITGVQSSAGYGANVPVSTPDAVEKAVLVAPGAATHGADMSQRYVPVNLTARADGNGVDIKTPASANVAPPGHYMLFLVNAKGVPSVAKFIRLGSDVAPPPPAGDTTAPTAPTGLAAKPVSAFRVDLTWVKSTDSVGVTAYDVYRDGAKIASPTVTSYRDTTADPGTSYRYTVRARDAAGNTSVSSASAIAATPAAENLLLNPGFELDADGNGRPDSWGSTSRFTRSGDAPLTGTYSGRHRATDNSGYSVGQVVTGLTAGKEYRVSGNVHVPTTEDAFKLGVEVRWRRADGTVISSHTVRSYTASGRWDFASKTYTAPTGTEGAEVRMYVSSLNATVYVDDFSLLR